jgi:23S rRNA pseudouridine2605 synthase
MKKRFQRPDKPENRFNKFRNERPKGDKSKKFNPRPDNIKPDRSKDENRNPGKNETDSFRTIRPKADKYKDDKPEQFKSNREKFKAKRPYEDKSTDRNETDRFKTDRYKSDKGKHDDRPKKKWSDRTDDRRKPEPPDYQFRESGSSKKNKYRKAPLDTRIKRTSENPEDEEMRLNRFVANSGICSRRDADKLIEQGLIKVNGKVVTELGTKVKRSDSIKYNDKIIRPEKPVYVLLNKPKDFITTVEDPENRKTVMQLVAKACNERIYPVGRLDRNTTGLLLLTNDGDMATRLSHPSTNIKKLYQVDLDKPVIKADIEKLLEGVELEDGKAIVDAVGVVTPDNKSLGIELHSGKNRIVRRIFESLGYEVLRLDRVMYAGLTKKDLARGRWRYLTTQEVIRLKHFIK